jgi:hypothetical protein
MSRNITAIVCARAGVQQRLIEVLPKERRIGQPGERIAVGALQQFIFQPPPVTQIAECDHEGRGAIITVHRRRSVRHREKHTIAAGKLVVGNLNRTHCSMRLT